jgi:thioredoxin reductase (NADPH)
MPDPIILVVDEDTEALKSIAGALERRFGADYRVLADESTDSAQGRMEDACNRGEVVALVIAADLEWLARTREACPTAARCVLICWGQPELYVRVRRALVLGQIETWLFKPCAEPEDRLYPVVGEILGGWVRHTRPRQAVLTIVGEHWSARCHEIRDRLERSSLPFAFYDHDGEEGRRLLEEAGHDGALPAVIFADRVLGDPTDQEIAAMLGARVEPEVDVYDLVIVGAGPAGLAAAVHGASNGLRTLVVERQTVGGQAGTSSLIRNYPGFPRGIGGAELAARTQEQAVSLGAEFVITRDVTGLEADGAERVVTLAGGTEVRARAVVIATGVSYNRLEVEGVGALVGKGVFYGAATTEAPALAGQDVFIVGAGNSAGQAAVHLARYAAGVTLLVRGPRLSMSDYLVRQIERAANIRIRFNSEIVRAEGTCSLQSLVLRDAADGSRERVAAAALFVMIGAGPHTGWLEDTLQRDPLGHILAGRHVGRGTAAWPEWPEPREPLPLETSLPGVFAVGDVRHRSPRGVTAAVADGAVAIGSVREYLEV